MNEAILEQVLEMKPSERLKFVQVVLASFDHEDAQVRDAWLLEVKRRIRSHDSGDAEFFDFEEVFN